MTPFSDILGAVLVRDRVGIQETTFPLDIFAAGMLPDGHYLWFLFPQIILVVLVVRGHYPLDRYFAQKFV